MVLSRGHASQILIACVFTVCARAQPPVIYNRAVLNAASFMPPRLPGGAIAQGSIFSIFGARLGPGSPVQATSFPLGTTLGGTSIAITQGATTVNAIPLYVSATQINAIMPSNAPVGAASMRVKSGAFQSNPMRVVIAPTAFGIFTATGTGLGPGILLNFIAQDNQPINSTNIPAKPGQIMTLYGTGLGAVPNDTVAPSAGNLPAKTEIFVGGVPATPLYSGRTPCCAGLDQLVFAIPDNAPQGCWVPVNVRTAGSVVSNFVSIAITSDGGPCLRADSPLANAGKVGGVVSLRVTTREDVGTRAPIDVTGDYAAAVGFQATAPAFPFHPILSPPPPGTCTVYTVKGDLLRGDTLPGTIPNGSMPLNLGAGFMLKGPAGVKMLQNIFTPSPLQYLGGSVSNNLFNNTLYLTPGSYTVNNVTPGDAGSFSASANMPQPLTWTNRDQTVIVNRSQPLNVSWSGGSGSNVIIVGFGVDLPTDSTTVFGCVAPDGATSFSIPAMVLANVPPTRPNPLQSKSVIYLGNSPSSSTDAAFNSSGLDTGFVAFRYLTGKTVLFQ